MTGWIVVGCILLFFLAVASLPVKLEVSFGSDIQTKVTLRILFLSFPLAPARPKKPRKSKREKQPPAQRQPASQPEKKQPLSALLQQARGIFDLLSPALRVLRYGTVIDRVRVSWCIAKPDAAQTAISYGGACAAFYGLLGVLQGLFSIRLERVRIYPDFLHEQESYTASFRVRLRVWRAVAAFFRFVVPLAAKIAKNQTKPDKPGKQAKENAT